MLTFLTYIILFQSSYAIGQSPSGIESNSFSYGDFIDLRLELAKTHPQGDKPGFQEIVFLDILTGDQRDSILRDPNAMSLVGQMFESAFFPKEKSLLQGLQKPLTCIGLRIQGKV